MSGGPSARVETLTIAAEVENWRAIGLVVTDEGLIPLIGTSLRIVHPSAGADGRPTSGIIEWVLSGIDEGVESIDGLPTAVVEPSAPLFADHPLAATALDHVVVTTPELERTSAAIAESTGCELRRVRESNGLRQGFHRIGRGGLIVELVTREEMSPAPASFWGLVISVGDVDAAHADLGSDVLGEPRAAVQPGRRIATFHEQAGLGLPVAVMTP